MWTNPDILLRDSHHLEKSKSVRIFFFFVATFAYSNSSVGSSAASCCLFFSLAAASASYVKGCATGPWSRYLPTAVDCRLGCSSIGSLRLLNHVAIGSITFSTFGLLSSARTSLKGFLKTSVFNNLIVFFGLSFSSVSQALKRSNNWRPPTTRPNIECLLSRCG